MSIYNQLQPLAWDSNFFGLSVAKIEIKRLKENLDEINSIITENDFDLIYCFADPHEGTPDEIEKMLVNAKWVDGKITYLKEVKKRQINTDISFLSILEIDDQLYQLAIKAGAYSRFRIDTKFRKDEYENLYKKWIQNSVDKTMADATIIYRVLDKALGLITIGKKNDRADIGLLAVDELARGAGIATELLNRAELYAFENNFKQIQVVTQLQNLPACRLYEKCNFQRISLVNIFHIWK